jgi:hypothetical protein
VTVTTTMARLATTVLGKRKSRSGTTPAAAPGSSNISQEEAQAIFRRHFEAQFAPLAETKFKTKNSRRAESEADGDEDEDDEDDDSMVDGSEDGDSDDGEGGKNEWTGLSGSEDDDDSLEAAVSPAVEVVDYSKPTSNGASSTVAAALSKREAKAYLSSKVPTTTPSSMSQKPAKKTKPTPTDEDSADLLRNDLALQRLLSEAHLLNPTKASHSLLGNTDSDGDRTAHTGHNRLLATDLRLAALGSRASIYKQQRMPMAHRKGIEGAKATREAKRRREAKENGIILERPIAPTGGGGKKNKSGGGGTSISRRERAVAVDAPAVGRMRDGMLRLSKRDVAEIQGDGRGRGGGGKMKKRRR